MSPGPGRMRAHWGLIRSHNMHLRAREPTRRNTDRLSDVSLSLMLFPNGIAQAYRAGGIGHAFEAAVGDSQGVIVRAQEESPHRPSGGTRIRLRAGGAPMQHPLIDKRR
jgi:hypothetical protein